MIKNFLIIILLFSQLHASSDFNNSKQNEYIKSLGPGGSKMIFIPEGNYYTGEKISLDNSPLQTRNFKSFFIDIHPVTNIQYIQFIDKTNYKPMGKFSKKSAIKHPGFPVTGITLDDASAYAEFVGKRIPTEWEWEIAARSLKKDYSSYLSNIYRNREGVFFKMERKGISPIFSTPPNGIGIYDHIGNVFEWTTGEYPSELIIGKNRSVYKIGVIKGGAWTNIRNDIKYSTRTPFPVKRSLPWLGFRCVKDLK